MTHNHAPAGTQQRESLAVKHEEALACAYKQVIRRIPFSSIAQVYECVGESAPDPGLGRSCVGQSLELGRLLQERGLGEVSYLCGERHMAVRSSLGERTYLLDPFLLHAEPIDLKVATTRRRMEVSSYPLAGERRGGRLALRSYHSGMLVLASYIYDRSAGEHRLRRHFKLALEPLVDQRLPLPNEITPLLFWPEQTTLSIRVVTDQLGLLELIYPVAVHHGSGRIDESHLLVCANDDVVVEYEERDLFEALLATFCRTLGIPRKAVIEHALGGVQLYEQHAPRHISFGGMAPLEGDGLS